MDVEFFRVEAAARPLAIGCVFFVFWVMPGFEEGGIAGDAADIFGRPMPGTVGTDGIFDAGLVRDEGLDFNEVEPTVSEVVLVEEMGVRHVLEIKIAQTYLGCFENRAFAQAVRVEFGGTINEAADDELMQV